MDENITRNNPWLAIKEPVKMGQSITRIHYNWFANKKKESFDYYEVGYLGCTRIEEHRPTHEGDRWYFDAHHDDGVTVRIFNPNTVQYKAT